ncbi:MAG: integrase arm-type DNA-binding domain-containing protein, partial [Gammaproteobacteria bacterium]|nr:integrase arm-type DNA-binding domain-containing protein [Gammaproteobacteria bacterium]
MLSDAKCRHATGEGKKIRKLPDSSGLYLWVYADGKKYWRLRYWLAGKEKSLSLGVYPRIGLKEARRRRDVELKRLDNNLDPAAERRAEKIRAKNAAENSFEAVAREWHKKQRHLWVPTHAADVLRRLEKNAFPDLGRRPIAEIDAPELLAAMRKTEARGAYDLAHRVLQVCGQVFRYGIVTGRCTRNVAA